MQNNENNRAPIGGTVTVLDRGTGETYVVEIPLPVCIMLRAGIPGSVAGITWLLMEPETAMAHPPEVLATALAETERAMEAEQQEVQNSLN